MMLKNGPLLYVGPLHGKLEMKLSTSENPYHPQKIIISSAKNILDSISLNRMTLDLQVIKNLPVG